jgi:hypothetical protein
MEVGRERDHDAHLLSGALKSLHCFSMLCTSFPFKEQSMHQTNVGTIKLPGRISGTEF